MTDVLLVACSLAAGSLLQAWGFWTWLGSIAPWGKNN